MELFRAELRAIEDADVDALAGRPFMGRPLAGPDDLLTLVKQIVPDYKHYRSFAHCLEHGGQGRGEAVA